MEDAAAVEEHSRVYYNAIPRQIIGVGRYSNSTAHHNQEDECILASDLSENKFYLAKYYDF